MPLAQTWPITLPNNFQQNGYTEGDISNFVETAMDSGPAKRRKKQTKVYKPISGQMIITTAQKAIFQAFFTDTIGYGSLPFTMPTYGGATIDVYIDSQSIAPKSGSQWTLSMTLRALV